MLGARLKQLGVPTIVVEKNARPGDSWRNRYRTLVLHDPVWYDHLPYIPFPDNWPVFTPKDKMGDWLEMYAKVMELNYWGATECARGQLRRAAGWTVIVERDGRRDRRCSRRTSSSPPAPTARRAGSTFPGRASAANASLEPVLSTAARNAGQGCSSSARPARPTTSASTSGRRRALTMIQRSPTTVVRSETLMELGFDTIRKRRCARHHHRQGRHDRRLDALRAAAEGQRALYDEISATRRGLLRPAARRLPLDFGDDETGLMMKAYRTGSGYYIDVGASELIIDGEIKVRSGVEIERLTADAGILDRRHRVPADVIVFTGFQSMNESVAQLVSREVADKIGPCWGFGSGTRAIPAPGKASCATCGSRPRRRRCGSTAATWPCRASSRNIVALQIKARMEGIATPVY